MKTFDKYLFNRYLSVFGIMFVSTFGLFVVIDGFTNVDGFQEGQTSAIDVLLKMMVYYAFQCSPFFDMVGSILSIVSIMVVFALLYMHSEIHPILAAGIPIYRLLFPVLAGTLLVSAMIIGNQELVIPRISHRLQSSRDESRGDTQKVEQIYDYETGILVGGDKLHLKTRRIEEARFVLPVPRIVDTLAPLEARQATFYSQTVDHPAGWELTDVSPKYGELNLTKLGSDYVFPTRNPQNLFVATDVSFDQLSNRSRSYKYISTPELIRRIKNPSFSIVSIRGQMLNLHARFTRPLMDLLAVLVAVPIIIRKESRGLVGNMALCAGVLGFIYGVAQASLYLGSVNLIGTEFALWVPIIFTGTLGVWLFDIAQT